METFSDTFYIQTGCLKWMEMLSIIYKVHFHLYFISFSWGFIKLIHAKHIPSMAIFMYYAMSYEILYILIYVGTTYVYTYIINNNNL